MQKQNKGEREIVRYTCAHTLEHICTMVGYSEGIGGSGRGKKAYIFNNIFITT